MATMSVRLPLTRGALGELAARFAWTTWVDDHLFFTVEDGRFIVSTEPLGDDPSVTPLAEGVHTQ